MIVFTSDSSYHVRGNVEGHFDWTLEVIFVRAVIVFIPVSFLLAGSLYPMVSIKTFLLVLPLLMGDTKLTLEGTNAEDAV